LHDINGAPVMHGTSLMREPLAAFLGVESGDPNRMICERNAGRAAAASANLRRNRIARERSKWQVPGVQREGHGLRVAA
jgi:hypothetical protein